MVYERNMVANMFEYKWLTGYPIYYQHHITLLGSIGMVLLSQNDEKLLKPLRTAEQSIECIFSVCTFNIDIHIDIQHIK